MDVHLSVAKRKISKFLVCEGVKQPTILRRVHNSAVIHFPGLGCTNGISFSGEGRNKVFNLTHGHVSEASLRRRTF